MATMLAYRGIDIDAKQLEPRLYIPGREGSLALEIVAQARQFGMLVYPLAPELDQLMDEIEAGNPVLVLQNLGFAWLPQWHFAVVVGYDSLAGTLWLRSGNEARKQMSMQTFLNTWRRAKSWAVVIVPPNDPPATAQPFNFVRAAVDLEQVNQTLAARDAYLSFLQRWPDDLPHAEIARLGLANLAYQRKDYREAQDWLSQTLKTNPAAADSWNNLAFVLKARGCLQQARDAADCAVGLQPERDAFQQTRQAMRLTDRQPAVVASPKQCWIPACPVQK